MRKYHAHFYYELAEREQALRVHQRLIALFSASGVQVAKLHDHPVGPHPLPMFTVMFTEQEKRELIHVLDSSRGNSSILIHEDTGDDYRDHTVGVRWLGVELPIHFEHFEKIKHDKNAFVFPEGIVSP